MPAEQRFRTITVFEQRNQPRGAWNYTGDEGISKDNTPIPNAAPRQNPQSSVSAPIISPVYDSLETNIPNLMMQFCDFSFPPGTALFPTRRVVQEYLCRYAKDVLDIYLLEKTKAGVDVSNAQFDAVVVINGHYNKPNMPSIPSLEEWNQKIPGVIVHSSAYRRAAPFTNKKVIILSHPASGIDIAAQIGQVSKHPLLISERTTPTPTPPRQEPEPEPPIVHVPEITHLNPQNARVRFSNGHEVQIIDHIIFCTGYLFSLPFLSSLPLPIVTDGLRLHQLYNHVFYSPEPNLAFIGTTQFIVPFPFSQAQSAWVARVFAGRIPPPSSTERTRWLRVLEESHTDENGRRANTLAFPLAEYINSLYGISMGASRREGLENEGRGKEAPFWGERERLVCKRFPVIKKASRLLGERRKDITSLEGLRFYFGSSEEGELGLRKALL
ncbi:hypothetical protein BDW62DRAFT_212717 [Aspergillus aurantiobrunneus]